MRRSVAVLALLLAAACGGGAAHDPSATAPTAAVEFPTGAPVPTYSPTPPASGSVHFDTPEAAMRYLADAWNRGDITELKHVTDPAARDQLQNMHYEAADLKLDHCVFQKDRGDYECYFTHGFPSGYPHRNPFGTAEFTVGPAARPGWYMTYFVACGGR